MQTKQMLAPWSSVTEQEYPQYVHLIPHPYEIELAKTENGGVMTDTCNSEQKENRLIAAYLNGVVHSMFLHNHMRNVWANNVLDSLTEFLRSHINDSIDKVAPEFRVYTGFIYLACAFEKMFSLYENYPKGLDEVFCQRKKEKSLDCVQGCFHSYQNS